MRGHEYIHARAPRSDEIKVFYPQYGDSEPSCFEVCNQPEMRGRACADKVSELTSTWSPLPMAMRSGPIRCGRRCCTGFSWSHPGVLRQQAQGASLQTGLLGFCSFPLHCN